MASPTLTSPPPHTFTTRRNMTYAYHLIPSTKPTNTTPDKPPLLLLHGFPDSSLLWTHILSHLTPLHQPILIPDLLGYGGTSKPSTPSSYNSSAMCDDLADLLRHENFTTCIPIGHDWGAFLAGRFWLWHPEMCTGLVTLNVAYSPPSGKLDLDAMLAGVTKAFGYPLFEYWKFFISDEAVGIIEDNLERFYTAVHGSPDHWMRKILCVPGALENYMTSTDSVTLASYATSPENAFYRDDFLSRYRRDGFTGPLNWYKAQVSNHHWDVEKVLQEQGVWEERSKVTVPVLFVACNEDDVCRPEIIEMAKGQGWLPDLRVERVESRHWCTLERPDEVGTAIASWLEERKGDLVAKK